MLSIEIGVITPPIEDRFRKSEQAEEEKISGTDGGEHRGVPGQGEQRRKCVVITGGSLSEYEEFKKAAISNVPKVSWALGEQATVKMSPASRKRKDTDLFCPVGEKKYIV